MNHKALAVSRMDKEIVLRIKGIGDETEEDLITCRDLFDLMRVAESRVDGLAGRKPLDPWPGDPRPLPPDRFVVGLRMDAASGDDDGGLESNGMGSYDMVGDLGFMQPFDVSVRMDMDEFAGGGGVGDPDFDDIVGKFGNPRRQGVVDVATPVIRPEIFKDRPSIEIERGRDHPLRNGKPSVAEASQFRLFAVRRGRVVVEGMPVQGRAEQGFRHQLEDALSNLGKSHAFRPFRSRGDFDPFVASSVKPVELTPIHVIDDDQDSVRHCFAVSEGTLVRNGDPVSPTIVGDAPGRRSGRRTIAERVIHPAP